MVNDLKWTRVIPEFNSRERVLPTEMGHYRILVAGDSESIDGHTIYDFPDYETWCEVLSVEEEEGKPYLETNFMHGEEWEFVVAWYGPVEVPTFKEWEDEQKQKD